MREATVLESRRLKFIRRGDMKLYYPEDAMELIGISRDTFFRWIKSGKIKRIFDDPKNLVSLKKRKKRPYYISDLEIERVKTLIKEGWTRAAKK